MNSFLDAIKITIELHSVVENRIKMIEYLKVDKRLDSVQIEIQKQKLTQLNIVNGHLTFIIQIMNAVLCDYVENECLSLSYLQRFHVSIQNRVEIIYRVFQQLERFETYREVIMM